MFENHILNKSGTQSVGFRGEEIAKATDRDTNEKAKFEWDSVRVFRIDPEWAKQMEADALQRGKKIHVAPYWVGICKGTLWATKHSRFKILYAETVTDALALVQPKFQEVVQEQLRLTTPVDA